MPNLSLYGTVSFLLNPSLCITLGNNFFQRNSFHLDSGPAFPTHLAHSTRPDSIKQIHFGKKDCFALLSRTPMKTGQTQRSSKVQANHKNLAHIICQSSKLQSVKPFYFGLDSKSSEGKSFDWKCQSQVRYKSHFFRSHLPPGSLSHAHIFFLKSITVLLANTTAGYTQIQI